MADHQALFAGHVSCVLLIAVCLMPTVYGTPTYTMPKWKQVFWENRDWQGYYYFNKQPVGCSLHVYSVQQGENGMVSAQLSDDETEVQLSVFSDDSVGSNSTVVFQLTYITKSSDRFPESMQFQMHGLLDHHSTGGWYCSGTVTKPTNSAFGNFTIHTPDNSSSDDSSEDDWRLGVKIGVPVAVGIVTIAIAIGIMVWAVRKGYIRHVPGTYKIFKAPAYTSNGEVHM